MKASEIAVETAGSICFMFLMYLMMMVLYAMVPYEAPLYNETPVESRQ